MLESEIIGRAIDAALLTGLAAALVSGRIGAPRAFAVFALLVIVTGRVDFATAFAALGQPAIWAVMSLVVFSLALGKLALLRQLFFSKRPRGLRRTLARLLGSAAAISAFVPNTAVVAAMLGPASRRPTVTPHQLLLPLSYVALAAGMLTPFGTSASLMVVGLSAAQGIELTVLDFVIPGALVVIAVLATLLVLSPILLREKPGASEHQPDIFHVEARVAEGSRLAGRSVATNKLRHLQSFFLAEVVRGDRVIAPITPRHIIREGDVLIFVGDVTHIDELRSINGLSITKDGAPHRQDNLYRAVVAAGSHLVGRTLRETDFRARFDASVLGIERGGTPLSGKLGALPLSAGDMLLLAAGPDFHRRDNLRSNLHLIDSDDAGLGQLGARDTLLVGLAFAAFLACALFQLVPIAVAAFTLASVTVLMEWVSPREVRRAFPFDLAIVLWGAVLLSLLVSQSGLSGFVAGQVAELSLGLPPAAVLITIFLLAWILTEFFSNTSAALTVLPIALDTAVATGMSPTALALATAFGASASFLMPFGYQTHLMVLSPGRYTMADFLKLGGCTLVAYSIAAIAGLLITQL
ncbi:SLC13 family permease [Marinicauda algicola]|uniref:SLC13 family permease n=1 Tax=Marinicauda algicola TaxID=2029849 RepID=UPI001305210E|nr:SLC13 family permease [Marinicauda algicola]